MTNVPAGCPISADFDPFGPEYQTNPQVPLAFAREHRPVFYSTELDYFIVTRHADIRAVFTDTDTFSVKDVGTPITPMCPAAQARLDEHDYTTEYGTLAHDEEPLHMQRRRRLAEPYLAPAVAPWEPRVREVFTEYIDAFVQRGEAELVSELFWDAPAVVALEFMGLDEEEVAQAKQYAQGIMDFVFGKPTEQEQIEVADLMGRHQNYSRGLIERLIENSDGPGVLKYAVRAYKEDSELFDKKLLLGLAMLDLAASHQTTSYGSSNAVLQLLRHRESWEEICEDPALIPGAVDECLRFAPPLYSWRRTAKKDTKINGVPIPGGGRLLLFMGSGNFDPDVFEDPERFDIRRANARKHLTFGFGPHTCLGNPLARLEIKVFVEELNAAPAAHVPGRTTGDRVQADRVGARAASLPRRVGSRAEPDRGRSPLAFSKSRVTDGSPFVVIVTGSAGGIGAAAAIELARQGASVVVSDIRLDDDAQAVARRCAEIGGDSLCVATDVTVDEECRSLVAQTVERWGRLDALVNNAAKRRLVDFEALDELAPTISSRRYAVNVVGAFQMTVHCVAQMRSRGSGSVVNVSSIAAKHGTRLLDRLRGIEGRAEHADALAGADACATDPGQRRLPGLRRHSVHPRRVR